MKLSDHFSEPLKALLSKIDQANFELCLVGGAVRDFLKNGILNNDLDFELRRKISKSYDGHLLQDLIFLLENENIKFELLPYNIVKFRFEDFELEFSPPRIEIFNNEKKSHHNFIAKLDFDLNYRDSFLRRDFTINSIGLVLRIENSVFIESLEDPFNGISDLHLNLLKSQNPNFYKDPVRLLRLVRFSIKLDLDINQEILTSLSVFDLSDISYFHFWREAFKVDVGKFLNSFCSIIKAYSILMDDKLLNSLQAPYPENNICSPQDLIAYTFFKIPSKAKDLSDTLSMGDKFVKSLELFYDHYVFLVKEFPKIKIHFKLESFADYQKIIYLKSLKFVDQHREFLTYLRFSDNGDNDLPFDLGGLDDVKIDLSLVESTLPEYRSFLKYNKFLINVLGQKDV